VSGGHDLYLDLCAASAVGSIEPADRRVLEEHLDEGCAECTLFLRDACGPLEVLASSSRPALPSRGLKARVMVAIARRAAAGPEPRSSTEVATPRTSPRLLFALPGWAWTAAALLLVALGLGWWRTSVLAERVRELEGVTVAGLDAEAQWAAFLRQFPQAKVIELAAQPGSDPLRKARVAYDAVSRRALAHFTNFQSEPGADFELWTVRDKQPYSEGLVRVGKDGRGIRHVENVGDPALLGAFAVSREPQGGASDRRTPTVVQYAGGVS